MTQKNNHGDEYDTCLEEYLIYKTISYGQNNYDRFELGKFGLRRRFTPPHS